MHSGEQYDSDATQSLWDRYHYKAFISYSRDDRAVGSQIQKQLEKFKVPKALRGRQTANGPVPARIAPVFRDLSDMDAHGSLTDKIKSVLSRSAYLIVLCSPSAAKSYWVNNEIETFIRLGGADRIVAILVDGEPLEFNEQTCPDGAFPPALVNSATSDDDGVPIAPDLRREAEGLEFTVLKTAASIIGVSPDILSQRVAERERRDKQLQRRIAAIMTALTALAIVTSIVAFQKLYESETRRSIALAGRASQAFADQKYDQALITATAALPDHRAIIHAPSTPTAEYAFRRSAYLNRLIASFHEHQADFEHDNHLHAIAVSPDGKLVVSGDHHGGVKIWRTDAAQSEASLEGHICGDISKQQEQCEVTDVAFSPNGKLFASASYDDTVRVWSSEEKTLLHLIEGHEPGRRAPTGDGFRFSTMFDGRVNAIDFSPDSAYLATASWDGTARVWDMSDGQQVAFFEHGPTELYDVSFSPDGAKLATAAGKFAGVWDRTNNALLVSFEMPEDADAFEVAFSPSGDHVAVAYTTGDAIIYDAISGERIAQSKIDGPASLVRYSKDGSRLFFGGDGTSMQVIDALSGREIWQTPTMDTRITAASFILESRFGSDMLMTAGTNGRISVYNVATGHEAGVWRAGDTRILGAAVADDGEIVVTAQFDGSAAVWRSNLLDRTRLLSSVEYSQLAFSPSGAEALIVDGDGAVLRYDAKSGEQISKAFGQSAVTALAYIDERTALTASRNKTVDVIDLQSGEITKQLYSDVEVQQWSQESASRWKYDRHRRLFAAAFDDQRVLIVQPKSEAPPFFLPQEEGDKVCNLEIDPEGKRIATLTHGGVFSLFDTEDFSLITQERFEANSDTYDCYAQSVIAISANSKTVAAGVNEKFGVWRLRDGKKLREIESAFGNIGALALSADGQLLYFSGSGRVAEFYKIDLSQDAEIHTMPANSAIIKMLSANHNGSIMISGGINWSIGIWDAATGGFFSSMVLDERPTSVVFDINSNRALIGLGYRKVYIIELPMSQSGVELSSRACAELPINRRFTVAELNDPFLSGLLTPSEKRICR